MKEIKNSIVLILLTLTILSCKKSTEDNTPAPSAAAYAGSFIWKKNGVSYTLDSAHYSLCCSPTVTTIFAYHRTSAGIRRFFEININVTANGSFNIPASGFNPCALYYA